MSRPGVRTDEELAAVDVGAVIAAGLRAPDVLPYLMTHGAVPAAIQAGRAGVLARSLHYLAEIVHRGGTDCAVQLSEPLPTAGQTALVRPWLAVAAAADADESFARWLHAVATIIDARSAGPVPSGGRP